MCLIYLYVYIIWNSYSLQLHKVRYLEKAESELFSMDFRQESRRSMMRSCGPELGGGRSTGRKKLTHMP